MIRETLVGQHGPETAMSVGYTVTPDGEVTETQGVLQWHLFGGTMSAKDAGMTNIPPDTLVWADIVAGPTPLGPETLPVDEAAEVGMRWLATFTFYPTPEVREAVYEANQ